MQTGVVDGAENNLPSFVAQNHYQVAKYFSMTEHLIIPELLVFSKVSWDKLSKDDGDAGQEVRPRDPDGAGMRCGTRRRMPRSKR